LIFYVDMVDAGTVEMIREFGHEIVSSGDLVAQFEAALSDEQIRAHFRAREKIDPIPVNYEASLKGAFHQWLLRLPRPKAFFGLK
jgi:hypothetical protein